MRHIRGCPKVKLFKPAGIPARALEVVTLTLDELEALRLADFNALYQEEAAEQMKISRATFARIVEEARRKTADALIHGKAVWVEGGTVTMKGESDMPNRDGTGPIGGPAGQARGPCWCGQRNRRGGRRGAGGGRGRWRHGQTVGNPAVAVETAEEAKAGKEPKEL
jgi:predicted DNA-binding protein (UPF0251 family)